jgi:hypothetical protein
MVQCFHCGTDNLDGSEYCDECGAKLAASSAPPPQAHTPPPAQFITQVAPPPPPSFTKESITPKPATPYTPPPPPPPIHTPVNQPVNQAQAQAPDRAVNFPPPPNVAGSSANNPKNSVQSLNQTAAFNGQTSGLRGAAAESGRQQVMNDEDNLPQARAKLIIQRGGKIGKEFPIHSAESMIGRWDADGGIFPDVDLDQDDPEAKVSRRHARIHFLNNQYLIEDLGSTNGTFINRGPRLLPGAKQPLNNGDEIIVGKTFLKFVLN